ncbi:MAG: polysaccharide biosynthesis/export family protein [Nitrospirota bacterium]
MIPRARPTHFSFNVLSLAGWAATALLLIGNAGCVVHSQPAGRGGQTRPVEQTAKPTNGVPTDYIIGAGDVLEILVWKNTDISRTVTVRPDGKISLPLLNDVQAAGLTPMALKEQIAQELKKFKELPEVSVIVTDTKSQVVYLMGQVTNPGPYPLTPNTTILQVIAQGGGFTPFAARDSIVVIRRGENGGKEQRIRVNYNSILAGRVSVSDIALHAGDTIVVP